ncbi:MAG: PAS domain S-box protein [Pseudomonadota bacterium]
MPPKFSREELEKRIAELESRLASGGHPEEDASSRHAACEEMFTHVSAGIAVYGAVDDGRDFVFKDMNPAGERISQVSREEILGKGLLEMFPGVVDCGLFEIFQKVWRTGEPGYLGPTIYRDDRVEQSVENRVFRVPSGDIIAIYSDVTEQVAALRRQNLYAEVLGILNHSGGWESILDSLLEAIVEFSGFEAVGIRLRQGGDFPYLRSRGFPDGFLEQENSLCACDTQGKACLDEQGRPVLEGLCGNVVQDRVDPSLPFFTQAGSFWTNSTTAFLATTTEKERQGRTRNLCNTLGYESLALIPLRVDGDIVGLLHLADHRRNRLSSDMVEFFEMVAASIGVALKRMAAEEQVGLANARLGLALKFSGVGLWDWNITEEKLYFSPEWKKQIGYEPDELKDEFASWENHLHPEDKDRVKGYLQSYLEGREAEYSIEFRLRHRDGSYRWILAQGEALGRESGKPSRMLGCHVDITGHKEAGAALAKSESLFRKVFETLPVGLWIADEKGTLLMGNPAGVKIWGGSPLVDQEQYGVFKARSLPSGKTIKPQDWALARTVNEGVTVTDELLEIDAFDGVTRTILNYTTPVLDDKGAIQNAIVVNLDITERRKAEEALRASAEKLHAIVDNIGICIALVDTDMRVLEMNRRMREWFPAVDLGKKPLCYQVFNNPPRDAICSYCPTCRSLEDGGIHETVTETPQGGGIRNYRIVSSAIRDAQGAVVGAIEMVEDISEKRLMEAQFLQAQKMEAVGRLAGGVAHDFNNMLGVILGYAELALDRLSEDDPVREDLAEIIKAGGRSADLTRQLLAFARRQIAVPRVVDLNRVMEHSGNMMRRLVGEDIEVRFTPGPDLWPVSIDPSQVDQIIANMMVNARDAIHGVGRISLETENVVLDTEYCRTHLDLTPGEYTMLSISDTGEGMDRETREQIFEPFFTTKREGKGTGLGLSTVFGIISQNNGAIQAYSSPGKGTTFRIYLPRHLGGEAGLPEEILETLPRGRETILVVEDEGQILRLAQRILSRLGYRVLTAQTPGEALILAEKHPDPLNLLITDVVMPGMNGRELSERLTALKPGVKVLFMSGYTADVIAHHGVLAEGLHFIQKPFIQGPLARKVRSVLDDSERMGAEG